MHASGVSVTAGTFLAWQERVRTIAAFTAIDTRQQNLTSDGDPQQVIVAAVTRGFAGTVAVAPTMGRVFASEEFEPGREKVAIISHALWTTRYGGAPVVGRTMLLDDNTYTIVGVMPVGFIFPTPAHQVWIPMPMTAEDRENLTGHTLVTVARVRDGIPPAAAGRELGDIAAALRREFPAAKKDWDVTIVPAREAMVGKAGVVLKAMAGAVALLLVVACANIAGLLLTHGVSRTRELAVTCCDWRQPAAHRPAAAHRERRARVDWRGRRSRARMGASAADLTAAASRPADMETDRH